MIDLSYFLPNDEYLEVVNIQTECRVTDHFNEYIYYH